MMIRLQSLLFAAVLLAVSTQSVADETYPIRDAIRMVVITGDEGIHYERGCPFYELRALLADNESKATGANASSNESLFEIKLIGKAGTRTLFVGDRWMRTSTGTAVLSVEVFERITALIESRKGAGVPKARIEASVRRATKLIQHPKYVEDQRCAEQY